MRISVFAILFLLLAGCTNPPEYPIEPQIEYLSMSKSVMLQGQGTEDTTYITFAFTDGDGDLGHFQEGGGNETLDIFLTDLRTGAQAESFILPFVPELGAGNGISGEITVRMLTTCCIYPPWVTDALPCESSQQYPVDTLQYEIYIVDRAGHESNRIRTDFIYLQCQ